MTVRVPWPTAADTSSLPWPLRGIHTSGLPAKPFTWPCESAVTVRLASGPSPLMTRLSSSPGSLSIEPIIAPAVRSLPSAAVATGLVWCASRANCTVRFVVVANARISPPQAVPRTT